METLDLDRVSDTCTLFHRGTMRKAAQRQIFGFIANDKDFYRGRFFTTKLCRMVVKKLALKKLALKLQSDVCIFPMTEHWLQQQSARLLKLCRKAKKLPVQRKRQKPKEMDAADTLPYEPEHVQDSFLYNKPSFLFE